MIQTLVLPSVLSNSVLMYVFTYVCLLLMFVFTYVCLLLMSVFTYVCLYLFLS